MNTTDAIQALRAGDFYGLLNAVDVDERDTVDMTPVGPVITVARIGRMIVTACEGGPVMMTPAEEGTDPHLRFLETVEEGRQVTALALAGLVGTALNGSQEHLPMGFTV